MAEDKSFEDIGRIAFDKMKILRRRYEEFDLIIKPYTIKRYYEYQTAVNLLANT